jgi:hypothetical protein
MIWEGLTDHQLCELLKDPQQNGHRTAEQIVEHMHTPLVLWGWVPGEGRTPIPTPQHDFLAKVQEWAARGAACPAGESTRTVPGDIYSRGRNFTLINSYKSIKRPCGHRLAYWIGKDQVV